MAEEVKNEEQQTVAPEETQETKDAQAAQEEKQTEEKNEKPEKKDKNSALKKEIEELKAKLAASEEKAAKEHDTYVRLYAEFDNFRRRTSQEKLDIVSVASSDTIKGLLPVLDDCERAMKVLADSDDSPAAKEGTELIYNKLMTYLKGKGLAVIPAQDMPFDTDVHEAVTMFPVQNEEQKGKVFDVIQTGYTLNGKVIRFAKVVVGN